MLHRVIDIALLHIKLIVVQRSVFFFSFIMPIIFTALMGQANFAGGPTNRQLNVADEDGGPAARVLLDQFAAGKEWQAVSMSGEEARAGVRQDKAVAAVLIPRGFGESAAGGRAARVDFQVAPGAGAQAPAVEQYVRAALARASVVIEAAGAAGGAAGGTTGDGPGGARFDADLRRAAESFGRTPPVVVREVAVETPGRASDAPPSGADQSSPGMLVMFAMLFMVAGSNIVIYERQLGTLRRLLVMPMSRSCFLIGKLIGIYLLGLGQMAVLILAGALLFGVNWGQSPTALVLMVLSFGLVNTSLGILLSTVVSTTQQANALASMAVMAFSALGGAWWPLEIVPRWMNILGHVLPTAWAMDGFHDIVARGQSVAGVLPEVGVLLGMAVLFLTVSIWKFRYQ